MIVIVGMVVLIAVNVIILSINTKQTHPSYGLGRVAIAIVAPFQEIVTHGMRLMEGIWVYYFKLVTVAIENEQLRHQLHLAAEERNQYNESLLSNIRYRSLLAFKQHMDDPLLAAEVIGRDPSPWFKTIIVNKGQTEGVRKGCPVLVPEGIVGLVVEVTDSYSKILLIIDQNSAVDGLVQRNRSRGIIEGDPTGLCHFKYVLRNNDIGLGDTVISSGLDGVFPKGIRIGSVSQIVKLNAGIFQEIVVTPFVDFEKLEEVLIVIALPGQKFSSEP